MKLNYFGIFSKFHSFNGKAILIPEISEVLYDDGIDPNWDNKVITGYGYSLDQGTDELILKDKSFIEDVKALPYYLLFVASYDDITSYSHNDEWDQDLNLSELFFLGWTITANGDSATTDGLFPLSFHEDNNSEKITISDIESINDWGLIPNEEICKKYIELNNNEVRHLILGNNIEINTDWKPLGIYCDKYTYSKLEQKI